MLTDEVQVGEDGNKAIESISALKETKNLGKLIANIEGQEIDKIQKQTIGDLPHHRTNSFLWTFSGTRAALSLC